MAVLVQLSGGPGEGKTASIEPLTEHYKPEEIIMINADGKSLPWANWRKFFSKENKNYIETSNAGKILHYLRVISESRPEVKIAIVDTINAIMTDKEIDMAKVSGYDKWADLATDIYELYRGAHSLRDDLIVIFTAHIEPYDVEGEIHYRTKTNGKKLTKINLSSKLTYNLYTRLEHNGEDGPASYYFVTQGNGKNEARSTKGVLPFKMPNNLHDVVTRIRKFDLGIEDAKENKKAA